MLIQFSVSNFRSFRERQTLNLAASNHDKTLPDNCITTDDLPGLTGKRWVKGVALYGANASGKTTVIEALKALAELVGTSAKTTDPKELIQQIDPFVLCSGQEEVPTAFAVVFVADGIRFEYRVAATRERIWHESLRAFPKAKEQLWFCRDWNSDSGNYAWSPERPSGFRRNTDDERRTLSNVLFLSKAIAEGRSELEPVFRWFKEQLLFLDLSPRGQLGAEITLEQIQKKSPLHDQILRMLRHSDLGVTGVRAVEKYRTQKELDTLEKITTVLPFSPELREKILHNRQFEPELIHRGSNEADLPLPWKNESAGTHRFFGLAGPWLDILSNGHTICIDELEASMHPLMVRELLRLIFSNTENPKGAQIIFTTHNPLLLDPTLLRRDQIWFTDKDTEGAGHLYPLTDYQPRKGESLVRGYLSGRSGAVPFVPDGLLGSFPTRETAASSEKAGRDE